MALLTVFDIAGSGLSAQSVRLNTTASNLANADSVAGEPAAAYKARHPVFRTVLSDVFGRVERAPVALAGIFENRSPGPVRYAPDHPDANEQGMVYGSNVNVVEEMADMISASRSYEANVEVINTSKELFVRTLSMGR
jgi:flagellar basal-body rod protein FlgC